VQSRFPSMWVGGKKPNDGSQGGGGGSWGLGGSEVMCF